MTDDMVGRALDGLAMLLRVMFIGLCISVPLAIWKLIDIIIWIYHHIRISIETI